jgi:hypothetical protein
MTGMDAGKRLRRAGRNALAGLLLVMTLSQAQATISEDLYNEILFLQGLELGAGGRALALGGAYRALSDDFSGLYWNPAGLASVRRIEIGLGLSQSFINDETQTGAGTASNQLSRTRLNELGFVFPFPTYRGSLVIAAGYQQVHYFDSFGTFVISTQDSSFQGDELESGRLGLWSIGMAMDLSPILSAGFALRLWSGYDDYSWTAVSLFSEPNTWSRTDQSINTDLSGFNVITGILLRTTPWLRIGAALETPLKLKHQEQYDYFSETSSSGQYSTDSFSASYDYHISRPFRGSVGAAAMIRRFGLSADAVLNDWSQVAFQDEPPYLGLSQDQANREAARRLRTTADLHAGLEYWLPFLDARIQAGYAYLPTPLKNKTVSGNKNVFSGGVSLLLDQALQVQGTVVLTKWDRSIGGWEEKLQFSQFLVTLSYRF